MANKQKIFDFYEPGFKTTDILGKIEEGNKSLLSGETENLMEIPVNGNTQCILPSNLATITKKEAQELLPPVEYDLIIDHWVLTIDSTQSLIDHNERVRDHSVDTYVGTDLYEVWDWLTRQHIKGLQALSDGNRKIQLHHAMMYFGEVMRKTQKPKSKLDLVY